MSALLALAAGVTFACSASGVGALHTGDGFSVFAPAGRTFEEYRVSGPDASYFNSRELELVEDELPQRLMLLWRREQNSPVTLTIADHDTAAGTARFALSTERNPSSALYTPMTFEGTCSARREGGA